MRVLMRSQFYPPILGGAERVVRDFSTASVAHGLMVSGATHRQGGRPEFEYGGADVRLRAYAGLRSAIARLPTDRATREHPGEAGYRRVAKFAVIPEIERAGHDVLAGEPMGAWSE